MLVTRSVIVYESARNIAKRFLTNVESRTILSDECNHFKCMLLTEDTFKNN